MTTAAPETPAVQPAPRDQVIAWLLEGQSDSDIKQAIAARWPDADPAELTTAAVDHFAKASEFDLAVVIGWALEAYRDLYRRMVAIGDFAGAAKALKELVALATTHGIRNQDDEGDPPSSPGPANGTPAGRPAKA